MKASTGKTIFFIAFPLISVICIISALLLKGGNTTSSDPNIRDGSESSKQKSIPQIVTVHPTSAVAGEPFQYILKIVDSDSDPEHISAKIIEGPSWISFTDKLVLGGIPEIEESNVQKVIILISDGENSVSETFYLLITENDKTTDE